MSSTPVSITVAGSRGATLPDENLTAFFGICSTGTSTTTRIGSIRALTDGFGQGPLIDAAALYIAQTKKSCYIGKVAQNAAGTMGSVTKTAAGAGTGTVADNSSAPVNKLDVVIIITTTGTVAGTSFRYKYSTDGGNNYSAIQSGAASVSLGTTGIALTFADGGGPTTGFIAGDVFTFSTVAPTFSTSGLTTAVTAMINDQNIRVRRIHVVAPGGGSSFHATAITLAGTTGPASYKYFRVLEDSDDLAAGPESVSTWQAGVLADFATQSNRCVVIAGFQQTILPVQQDGINQQRNVPISWVVGARIASLDLVEDPGKAPSIDGPLQNIVVDSAYPIRQDGRLYTAFEGFGITYGQSYIGLDGLYCAGGFTRIANSTDVYYRLGRCQVIDYVCEVAYLASLAYINVQIPAKSDGTIAEQAAQAIEADFNKKIADAVVNTSPQRVSPPEDGVFFTVDRTNNIVTTEQLKGTLSLLPVGYVGTVSLTVGYNINA